MPPLLCITVPESKSKVGIQESKAGLALVNYPLSSIKRMEEHFETNFLNENRGPVPTDLKLSSK